MSGRASPSVALWGADPLPVSVLADALRQAWPDLQMRVLAPNEALTAEASNSKLKFLLVIGDSATAEQRLQEAACRQAWGESSQGYQVIHGQGKQALTQALSAINAAMNNQASGPSKPRRPWVWACEKCSDADCEHRLLSDLLAQRGSQGQSY